MSFTRWSFSSDLALQWLFNRHNTTLTTQILRRAFWLFRIMTLLTLSFQRILRITSKASLMDGGTSVSISLNFRTQCPQCVIRLGILSTPPSLVAFFLCWVPSTCSCLITVYFATACIKKFLLVRPTLFYGLTANFETIRPNPSL